MCGGRWWWGCKKVYFRCGWGWQCGGGGCDARGVKKVYFRCGLGWECDVVLSALFNLREHIQNLNVFFFFKT